ncbi:DoxX family protein, partial [Klebsiella variicola]|uniref:DoxX family protein n=1 Tax=Klebsiella variicola TaxID=244366 RepID=UPI00195439AA
LIVFGMLPSGIGQTIHAKWSIALFQGLGYPLYLLTLIGLWKILGCIAIVVPKFPLVKEWAYAGLVFAMSGAA